jgi:hypothetical protein
VRRTTLIAALVAALAVLAFGASSVAAADKPTLVDDVAARLGISSDTLRGALRDALDARVDAAVKAGKLTPDQAAKLKERIANAKGLGLRIRNAIAKHRGAFVRGARIKERGAAATYIGITRQELRTELRSGKSLAQIATAHGKTAAGLVDAMLAPAKARLDKAVQNGRLTQEQESQMLARLQDVLQKVVERTPVALPG